MRTHSRPVLRRLVPTLMLMAAMLSPAFARSASANPYSNTSVERQRGFDTCATPSISQMGTWWTYSPYWWIGVYLGGSSYACAGSQVTFSWLDQAENYGYKFAPIWVGKQSPCNWQGLGNVHSYVTTTAYNQGYNEGTAAANAAYNVGIWGPNRIFLDVEAYNEGDTSCREATKNFIAGFVARLQQYGYNGSVYGSPCNAATWATASSVPNSVWLADGAGTGYRGVFQTYCGNTIAPPTGYWIWDQRLHQYQLDIYEVYGGVGLSIDANCSSAYLAGTGSHPTYSGCLN